MKIRWKLSRALSAPLLAVATLFAFTGGVQADETPEAPGAPPVPLLWKVSDADNSVYLLGSFHLLKPGDYPLSADVDAAFADATTVVFELPPEELGSPTLARQMAQAAMRTDGTPLSSDLPEETVARFDAWLDANQAQLAAMQIPPQALQMFQPWFVGLTVTIAELGKFGLDPALGLDAHFVERARQANKRTAGLETGEQQISFLAGMDKAEQVQMLQDALETAEEGQASIEKLHTAWREGDVDTMWREMALEMRQKYPGLYQRINVDRNDAWLPEIEAWLAAEGTDDTLLVVGALHLIGEDGVVEKLRAKGYEVERICSACE